MTYFAAVTLFFVLIYGIDGERASFISLFNQKDSNNLGNLLCQR